MKCINCSCSSTKNAQLAIEKNIPLKNKNWFKTGGNAAYFCQPHNAQEFECAIQFSKDKNVKVFLLGKGANLLISDEGFSGLTIHPQLNTICFQEGSGNEILVTAGAGVDLHTLITYCLDNHILGLEEFSGIPSTVGGAVYINLHYYEFLFEHFLKSAQVVDAHSGKLSTVDNKWFKFGYNISTLQERNHYLASATFSLKKASELETAYAKGRSKEIIRHREKRYPAQNTCGSFFRNFHENEVTLESEGKKLIFVAYYLDQLGIKGTLSVGDAIVSHQHANMIVNKGNATSSDIITLARTMQIMVRDAFGIIPQPECQLIGFEKYPLLK